MQFLSKQSSKTRRAREAAYPACNDLGNARGVRNFGCSSEPVRGCVTKQGVHF
jgi:hypothetical protein